MDLSPAAVQFLRDLYAARAAHEYRQGRALDEARAIGAEVVRALAREMRSGFITELDGEPCVEIAQPQETKQYTQGGLW